MRVKSKTEKESFQSDLKIKIKRIKIYTNSIRWNVLCFNVIHKHDKGNGSKPLFELHKSTEK